jgi:predicted lipoprotein
MPTNGSINTVKQMKKAPLMERKDDLSKCLRLAEKEEIVIARHLRRLCRAVGVLVGFAAEDDGYLRWSPS